MASEEYTIELERIIARTSDTIDKVLDRLSPQDDGKYTNLNEADIAYVVGMLEGVNDMIRPPIAEDDTPPRKENFIDKFKV